MSNLVQTNAIESALIQGDLSKLTGDQRLSYYMRVCESLKLNPLTKPFEYLMLNGKLVLYARRDASDQLRKNNKISITVKSRELIGDIYIVTANAKDTAGREDESTGAVNINGLKGDALANAYMKAETKAKRRVTLSICGLGMLDQSEIESIADAKEAIPNVFEEKKMQVEQIAHDPGLYEFKFGKYKGQRLNDILIHEIDNYIAYIKRSAAEKGKPLEGVVLEAVERGEAFLKLREPKSTDESENIPF